MSYNNPYAVNVVAEFPEEARAQFIRQNYGHLAIAVALFVALQGLFFLIHRYQPGQHVAAALSLFASIALLFWYVLRLLMALRRD